MKRCSIKSVIREISQKACDPTIIASSVQWDSCCQTRKQQVLSRVWMIESPGHCQCKLVQLVLPDTKHKMIYLIFIYLTCCNQILNFLKLRILVLKSLLSFLFIIFPDKFFLFGFIFETKSIIISLSSLELIDRLATNTQRAVSVLVFKVCTIMSSATKNLMYNN